MPAVDDPYPNRDTYITPARPASRPAAPYTESLRRRTSMPDSRVASSPPPSAWTRRPQALRPISTPTTSVAASITTTGQGTTPKQNPCPNAVNPSGSPEMIRPPEMKYDAPRAIDSMPSVAMNGGRPAYATSAPFATPQAVA